MFSLVFLYPEFFLSISLLNVMVWPLFLKAFLNQSGKIDLNFFGLCKSLSLFILFITMLLVFSVYDLEILYYGGSFLSNPFINFFKMFILFCGFIIMWFVQANALNKWSFPYKMYEFYSLFLFNILGSLCFISANNLLSIYISIELQALTLCVLLALKYFSKYSSEASLKYFIVSSFSSALLLLGLGLLYGLTGAITLDDISLFVSELVILNQGFLDNLNLEEVGSLFVEGVSFEISQSFILLLVFLFGFLILLIAFNIKLGAAPYHIWTMDVYEGAPTLVTVYALVIPKIAFIGFLLKFTLFFFYDVSFLYLNFFYFAGFFSLVFGTLGALVQTKIKRLFAYSAVSNFGYVLLALGCGNYKGVVTAIIFLVVYVFVTFSIFFFLISLKSALDESRLKSIYLMVNLVSSSCISLAFLFVFTMFNIASIPPFNLYIAKFLLLESLLSDSFFFNQGHMGLLASILIVLLSVVSCFYYIRLIRLLFFFNNNKLLNTIPFYKVSSTQAYLLSFCFTFSLLVFLNSDVLIDMVGYFFFEGNEVIMYEFMLEDYIDYFFKVVLGYLSMFGHLLYLSLKFLGFEIMKFFF